MYLIREMEIVKLNEEKSIIINLMNGNADLINNELVEKIEKYEYENIDKECKKQLFIRKYAFENEEKYVEYVSSFNNRLIKESKKEEPNFIYIPTFKCNLNCYYCFEKAYEKDLGCDINLNGDIEKLFQSIDEIIATLEEKYYCKYSSNNIPLLLTGGEPLLKSHHSLVEKIFKRCNEKGFPISIVTNGTTIDSFFDILEKYPVHEIQITLDGGKSVHDNIRITHEGNGTYDRIVNNLVNAKKYSDNLTVRINITKKNIESISELGHFMQENPDIEFYAYIMQQEGCYDFENVMDELEALKYLYTLKSKHSSLDNLYIAYHGYKIVDGILGKKIFSPKIKMCSAMQNQYIIDFNGGIYKCWWGMGNEEYLIGNLKNNSLEIKDMSVNQYLNRTVFNLSKCQKCKYRYLCGGGCSGRLTRSDMMKGEVMCPKFSEILNFILPIEIKKLNSCD